MMFDSTYQMASPRLRGYGASARELIRAPRNLGPVREPDSKGRATAHHCRGRIEVQLKVDRDTRRVREARFVASGCPAITATLSLATEEIKGKRIKEVMHLDWCEILYLLGAVPAESEGCVRAAVAAVREAAYDYLDRLSTEETCPGTPRARILSAREVSKALTLVSAILK